MTSIDDIEGMERVPVLDPHPCEELGGAYLATSLRTGYTILVDKVVPLPIYVEEGQVYRGLKRIRLEDRNVYIS